MLGSNHVQLSSKTQPSKIVTVGVSLRFTDPRTMVIPVPNFLVSNIGGIGFMELPHYPWSWTKFGLGSILDRVSKKGPYSAMSIYCVCVIETRMDLSSSGVKMCKCLILETFGSLLRQELTWNPNWALSPCSWFETVTIFVPQWMDFLWWFNVESNNYQSVLRDSCIYLGSLLANCDRELKFSLTKKIFEVWFLMLFCIHNGWIFRDDVS